MKLRRLTVAGFGRLAGRTFAFADGLNVVYGPNEAGKSTLAAAIVASLYGSGRRKEAWRPWDGGPYATTLVYQLADGRTFEVRRDYSATQGRARSTTPTATTSPPEVASGKTISPGDVHLQIPYDAFVNASCVLQQSVEIDPERNASIATALARALDGGPREDAALGAIKRLEDARKSFVGTPRSTVNNPLRIMRGALTRRSSDADAARAARDELAQLRERRAGVIDERDRLAERLAVAEREAKALRAAELRARLDQLHVYREDLAALQAERASYDDVATFPADRIGALDAAFYEWRAADAAAAAAEADAEAAQLTPALRTELAMRRAERAASTRSSSKRCAPPPNKRRSRKRPRPQRRTKPQPRDARAAAGGCWRAWRWRSARSSPCSPSRWRSHTGGRSPKYSRRSRGALAVVAWRSRGRFPGSRRRAQATRGR